LLVATLGRALVCVVELSEDHVEVRALDGICKSNIWDHTLGSCGDEVARAEGFELVDEVSIVGGDTPCWDLRCLSLEVQIETIDELVTERARACVGQSLWAYSVIEPFSKVSGNVRRRQVVVQWCSSTKRQQNLLAVLAALLDTRLNAGAPPKLLALGSICRVREVLVFPARVS